MLNDASLSFEPETSVHWALVSDVDSSDFCAEIIQEGVGEENIISTLSQLRRQLFIR